MLDQVYNALRRWKLSKKESADLYTKYYYPSEQLHSNAVWVLQVDDVIHYNQGLYKVIQIFKSSIPGVYPKIVLDEEPNNQSI